jgi:hypothetical protein
MEFDATSDLAARARAAIGVHCTPDGGAHSIFSHSEHCLRALVPVVLATKEATCWLGERLNAALEDATGAGDSSSTAPSSSGTRASTRAGFLRTLAELIGPPPALDEHGRIPWRKEYELLSLLTDMEISCPEGDAPRALGFDSVAALSTWLGTREGGEFLMTRGCSLDQGVARESSDVSKLIEELGWEREHTLAFTLLYQLRGILARDLQDRAAGTAAAFPASSNYAVCEALFATAVQADHQRRAAGNGSRSSDTNG